MKYTIGSPAKTAKPFDANKALEELSVAYDQLGAAAAQVYAAEGRLTEVETVMDDCRSALESIKAFGVAPANMSLLNGGDHRLDDALGLEHLDIASIESLSASTKKVLKDKYVAGLEFSISEAWDKFVAWLKDFWHRIVVWFQNVFLTDAKQLKIVLSYDFNKLDEDATPLSNLCEYDVVKDAFVVTKSLEANFATDSEGHMDQNALKIAQKRFGVKITKKENGSQELGGFTWPDAKDHKGKTLGELGWTSTIAIGAQAGYKSLVTSTKRTTYMKKLEAQAKNLIAKAEKAKDDKEAQKDVRTHNSGMQAVTTAIKLYKFLMDHIGKELLKVCQTAAKKGDKKDTGARD